MTGTAPSAGVIGLGAMGAAYTRRLLDRGWAVLGHDPADSARHRHRGAGGTVADGAGDVAARCDVVITAVDSVPALDAITDEIASVGGEGCVIDTNTISRDRKERYRDALAAAGWSMLDCTVSGSPAMVLADDHTFFLSGCSAAGCRARRLVDCLASRVLDLGDFGNASTAKLVVNHLLTVHNAAAAEAFSLGRKAGMPASLIYDVVVASGGSSRMFEIRGKAMAAGRHAVATAFELLVDKDGVAIADLARTVRHPVPLFAAAYQAHLVGLAQGWGGVDPSSMAAVYETQSGQRPAGPAPADIQPADGTGVENR